MKIIQLGALLSLPLFVCGCLNSVGSGGDTEVKSTRLQRLTDLSVEPPPPKVNFELTTYCSQATWDQYDDFLAVSYNDKAQRMRLRLDADADGLTDEDENATQGSLALSSTNPFTATFGISDLAVFRAGIQVADQTRLRCLANERIDDDQDGILNCEERRLTYTRQDLYDTDGDGIPDGIELRSGLNPRNAGDATADPDADGVSNFDEIKQGTPIDEDNRQPAIEQLAYKSRIERRQVDAQGTICTVFQVTGVPMLVERRDHLMRFFVYERTNTSTNRGKRQLDFSLMVDISQWAGQTIRCTLNPPAPSQLRLTAASTPECPFQ